MEPPYISKSSPIKKVDLRDKDEYNMKRAKSPSKHNSHAGEYGYEKYLEDDDGDDSPYGSSSIKRTCFPSSSSVQSPHVPGEAKSVFAALDGGDPNASLAVLQILLEELKMIPAYFKDAKILLDMQELIMHLNGCSKDTAKKRISRLEKGDTHGGQNVTLSRYQIPGSRGTGKVVIELRHVLEYVLAQKGEVASTLRRALIEIASRAAAGDQDLFRAVSEWKKAMDPKMRAMLMSGYVRSESAKREDPLPSPEEVADPLLYDVSVAQPSEANHAPPRTPPPQLTWQEAKLELINADVCPLLLASPMGAHIVLEMRQNGLLSALTCIQKQMTIFNEWVESQARIARLDKETQDETTRKKTESDAKIENEKAEVDRLKAESEANIAAKIVADQAEADRLGAESAAIIKINSAKAKIELLEKKQALATKAKLDLATIDAERAKVDIEETKAWQMRQDMMIKKNESEARIRREDLNSALLRKQARKAEASIPTNLVRSTAVNFFGGALFKRCPGLATGVSATFKCVDKRTVTAFRFECVAKDDDVGKMIEESVSIVCQTCSADEQWHRHHAVHDAKGRRRTWMHANGSNVRGTCVGCDGSDADRLLHVADGTWQSCHGVPSALGGSGSPDHGNIFPGHSTCNMQQGDARLSEYRQRCGLDPTPKTNGFQRFNQKTFDLLDKQLGASKPNAEIIRTCLFKLNPRPGSIF